MAERVERYRQWHSQPDRCIRPVRKGQRLRRTIDRRHEYRLAVLPDVHEVRVEFGVTGAVLDFRRRVSLVFQNPDVQLFNPTVFDEVAYGPLQLQWRREEIIRRVEETLAMMALSHLKDRPPYRLSGGEKKRVALASVLVLDPQVLLLDEPTSALDPKSQSQIIDLIQQWKGTAKTVVAATHQLDIVEDIADRVIVLEEGRVIATGAPAEILSNQDLLLRANLIHAHRHAHGKVVHSHPHFHGHGHHEHEH